MTDIEFGLRLASGLGAGVLIGVERQWRQRGAGLQTNALVAGGACLFVLLQSVLVSAPNNQDRIVAQVVSGVGFLGAGVIMRDGLNVRGVNTAATLWCAAAVGSLAGAGFYTYTVVGAIAVVVVNLALRPVGHLVKRQPGAAEEDETAYVFRAICRSKREAHVRSLVVQAMVGQPLCLRAVHSEDLESGSDLVEVRADLVSPHRNDAGLEDAVSRLSLEPGVTAVTWAVADNGSSDDDDPDGDHPPAGRGAGLLARWRR
jgi:putative Mg2+ transporter-C (MgtC) family protein